MRNKNGEWRSSGGRDVRKKYAANIRDQVIDGYGGFCVCCGETERDFLVLDHVNDDGATHRREIAGNNNGSGTTTYLWAIKNNFPNNLQLLCANCNTAKTRERGCPHRRG